MRKAALGNLFLILLVLFAVLALIIKLTEGKAQPLTADQQQRYSKIIMVLVGVSIIVAMIKNL